LSAQTTHRRTWQYWIAGAAILVLTAAAELAIGRRMWGIGGEPGIWSGKVLSPHNSQYLTDPYTFTHITHGILIYGLLRLICGNLSLAARGVLAIGLESGWEVLENTDLVITRYRTATLALNYFGDSVLNSMFDILACMAGFFLAARLPTRVTIAAVVLLEIVLAVWIRDGLLLNIVMLIHPLGAIKLWQAGHS